MHVCKHIMLQFNLQNNPINCCHPYFIEKKKGYTKRVTSASFHALRVAEWKASDPPSHCPCQYTRLSHVHLYPPTQAQQIRETSMERTAWMDMMGSTFLPLFKHTSHIHIKLSQQAFLSCLRFYNEKYSFEMENRQSLCLENAVKQTYPQKGQAWGSVPQGCEPRLSTPALWHY